MKLIIQIPCFNEEETLAVTFKELPKEIDGVDVIEYLIIDDGSTDRTVEIAQELGIDHIIKFPSNKGLAFAFAAGLDASLRTGADIIVNTDGDNQYFGMDIIKLVQPILNGEAEVVVGDRQTDTIEHFGYIKKWLQKLGSWVVRSVSNTNVIDATSGFRAYSRDAALKINLIGNYSYTLETILSAGLNRTIIKSVEISTNAKLRESRLISSIFDYLKKSSGIIIRSYTQNKPLLIFIVSGMLSILLGTGLGVRYLYFLSQNASAGHIQSLILSAIFILSGFNLIMFGLTADGIAANRKVLDNLLYHVKRIEYDKFLPKKDQKD